MAIKDLVRGCVRLVLYEQPIGGSERPPNRVPESFLLELERHLRKKRTVTFSQATKIAERSGYKASSGAKLLSNAHRLGYLRKVRPGVYERRRT